MHDESIADLCDHVELVTSHLRLRHAESAEDAMASAVDAQQRIASRSEMKLPITLLRERLSLSDSEVITLVMLAAMQIDERARTHLMREGGSLTGIRAELLRRLVHGDVRTAASTFELHADGRLRRFGLLRETRDAAGSAQMSITDAALDILHGRAGQAAGLKNVSSACAPITGWLAGASLDIDARLQGAMNTGATSVLVVSGRPGTGRRSSLVRALHATGRAGRVIELAKLAGDAYALRDTLRTIALVCRYEGAAPILRDLEGARPEVHQALEDTLVALVEGPILVTCGLQRPTIEWKRPVVVVELERPTTAELATLWHETLGVGTAEDAQRLAEQYPLAPALIHRASEAARARAGEREIELEDVHAGIRTVLDDKLGQYARRVEVSQRWDDIVLPSEQLGTIVELIARVRQRSKVYEQWGFAAKVGKGLGVSALFSGPPGTGKTMVAGLIARDLGLELYQVDMAKIVSKFIGETEKNLAALFDAAEAGHAILLFDEADALFGKRTDVKSSNDRYANLETNYLLQRMETFTGVVLLTSNHEKNIDPAFQRRLSLHLRFDVPDESERAALWRATLPADAPVAQGVDFTSLGRRYAMSGGYIKNAALRAAFIAADEESVITAAHLERAARVEYEGMGKIA